MTAHPSRFPWLAASLVAVMLGGLAPSLSAQAIPAQGYPGAPGPGATGPEPRLLTIEEALALARAQGDGPRAQAAALRAAQASLGAAKAAYLPNLGASATGAWLANPSEGLTIPAGAFGTIPGLGQLPSAPVVVVDPAKPTWFEASVTLSQPLVAWGKIKAGVDYAARAVDLAVAGQALALGDSDLATRKAYYGLKAARESRPLLAAMADLGAAIVADRSASVAEGLGTAVEVLSAKADLADLGYRLAECDRVTAEAEAALASLLGLSPGSPLGTTSPYPEAPDLAGAEASLAAAAGLAPETQEALARAGEARAGVAAARAGQSLLPSLALVGKAGVQGQTPPTEAGFWDSTWDWSLSLGLSASLNLFDGGRSRASLHEAEARLDAALAGAEGAGHQAFLRARSALAAARSAAAGFSRAEARSAWADQVSRNADLAREGNLGSRLDANRAALQAAAARLDLVAARLALATALAELSRAAPEALK